MVNFFCSVKKIFNKQGFLWAGSLFWLTRLLLDCWLSNKICYENYFDLLMRTLSSCQLSDCWTARSVPYYLWLMAKFVFILCRLKIFWYLLSIIKIMCLGRRNDKHRAHTWTNKWHVCIQRQWIDVTCFEFKSNTFLLSTCSGTCTKVVLLFGEFDGGLLIIILFSLFFWGILDL